MKNVDLPKKLLPLFCFTLPVKVQRPGSLQNKRIKKDVSITFRHPKGHSTAIGIAQDM